MCAWGLYVLSLSTNLPNIKSERDSYGPRGEVWIDKSNWWTRRKFSWKETVRIVVCNATVNTRSEIKMWLRNRMSDTPNTFNLFSVNDSVLLPRGAWDALSRRLRWRGRVRPRIKSLLRRNSSCRKTFAPIWIYV